MSDNHVCRTPQRQRELARFVGPDIWLEDHGWLMLAGRFDFGGSAQGFGNAIDATFLKGFLRVWNLEYLKQADRKPCWVTHCRDRIHIVEPLFPGEGTPFDVDAWGTALDAAAKEAGA